MPRQRVAVAFYASISNAGCRPANVRNALATFRNEVFGSQLAHLHIVDADKIRAETRKAAIDENQRHARLADAAQAVGIFAARRHNKAVQVVREHVLHFVLLQLRIALGRGNDEVILFFPQHAGESLGNLSKERMNEVGHHEPDERTAARDQTARGEVGAVVQPLHAFQNFGLRFLGNVGPVAQRTRNGDHRNA